MNRRRGYRCRHGHTSAHQADAHDPGWVYWSRARLVDSVLSVGDSGLAGSADASRVAAHLRAHDMLIVCGPDGGRGVGGRPPAAVTLEDSARDDAGAKCRTADAESKDSRV